MNSAVSIAAGSSAALVASEGDPQTGHQLVHAERLGDVVVGARVKGCDLLSLRDPRGQDDDRHGRPSPKASDHVDAVDVGESEIEYDRVGMAASGERQRLGSGRRQLDVIAAGAQVQVHGAEDRSLVVYWRSHASAARLLGRRRSGGR